MALIRLVVAVVTGLLLFGGYFAWHSAYFAGGTETYIKAVDASPVPTIALVLLTATVILAVVRPVEDEAE